MKLMDKAGTIALLELQIKTIDEQGTDQVVQLKESVEKDPKNAENHFDLGVAYNQMALNRNYLITEKARLEMQEDMEEFPPLDFSGTTPIYGKALEAFEKVLELEPEYYGVHTQMGITYGNLQQLDKAVECYKKALDDDPEDFSAAYYLGITYKDMGQNEQALLYLKKAQELNPEDEMLQEDLAELEQ